jgi:hypothetical protein
MWNSIRKLLAGFPLLFGVVFMINGIVDQSFWWIAAASLFLGVYHSYMYDRSKPVGFLGDK